MLYRSIYKCPLCVNVKTVFHDKEHESLPVHILNHVSNRTSTCYHCLVCPEVFETKAEVAEHLSSGMFFGYLSCIWVLRDAISIFFYVDLQAIKIKLNAVSGFLYYRYTAAANKSELTLRYFDMIHFATECLVLFHSGVLVNRCFTRQRTLGWKVFIVKYLIIRN